MTGDEIPPALTPEEWRLLRMWTIGVPPSPLTVSEWDRSDPTLAVSSGCVQRMVQRLTSDPPAAPDTA